MTEAARVIVSGIVQGVGFRYWTERVARELGVCGWVRNLADGRVEAFVEGERDVIDAFIERCKVGPRAARVTNVEASRAKPTGATSFSIRGDG
jgi:acylphosphatase